MEGEGTCRVMKCRITPGHLLTGELVATPLFEESETFKNSEHGLKQTA